MTETVIIRNRIGRDLGLSYVASRQETTTGKGDKVVIPTRQMQYTLAKANDTEIPKDVWDAQKKTAVIIHYLKEGKLEIVDKKTQVESSETDSDDKKTDPEFKEEEIELTMVALSELAEKGNKKPSLDNISQEAGFKVVGALRKLAQEKLKELEE